MRSRRRLGEGWAPSVVRRMPARSYREGRRCVKLRRGHPTPERTDFVTPGVTPSTQNPQFPAQNEQIAVIAKHGLVAIHTAASSPLVAPPGGMRPVLSTNPIAIAVPSSRGPIVLDIGTSAYMMTEVMLRERLGELLPEGVALGPGGEPTTAARRR